MRKLYSAGALAALILVTSCASTEPVAINSASSYKSSVLPLEVYQRAEAQTSWNLTGLIRNVPSNLNWLDENRFWYAVTTERGQEYIKANALQATRTPAFDQVRLASLISHMTGEEVSPWALPISRVEIDVEAGLVGFFHNRKSWIFDQAAGTLEEAHYATPPPNSNLSPDGTRAAFIREHNLWIRDMVSGDDIQLTFDGEELFGYATNSQGWNRSNAAILAWSSDSRFISTYQLDERGVGKMHLLETAEARPKLHTWPYALPGDTVVPLHHRVVIDIEAARVVRLNAAPDHQRTSNCCGLTRGSSWADNEFSADGTKLAFVSTSRDYKEVTLRIADTRTGEVRDVYHEKDEPFFESNLQSRGVPNWRVLHESNELIWYSRRSEWGHLYLHHLTTGSLKNQITSGDWNVLDIHHIDVVSRKIWFTAVGKEAGRDPYQAYLYVVNFDGSGLRLLTPEEGDHVITFSPDASYFVDIWSDFQNPQTTVIRNAEGRILKELEKGDISELLKTGWTAPEPFVAKARDGETDIYGILFKPSDFDPSRKYPIINNIYPGPQVGSIRGRTFGAGYSGQAQALAELGFIVVQIDALGTPLRSKSFHTAYAGDMADNGLPDQIAAMKQLAEQYSWIDINRVGMYGHSGGGFATLAAMLDYPEFFKVGVSSAGNHDNRGYTYYWGEKFQGLLERFPDGTDSYTNQALHLKAENLKGKLLISYGTMDSNVHPNMTLLVINALIRADKDFDLMVYPNRGHGYSNERYNVRQTWNYFVEHLSDYKVNENFRFGN